MFHLDHDSNLLRCLSIFFLAASQSLFFTISSHQDKVIMINLSSGRRYIERARSNHLLVENSEWQILFWWFWVSSWISAVSIYKTTARLFNRAYKAPACCSGLTSWCTFYELYFPPFLEYILGYLFNTKSAWARICRCPSFWLIDHSHNPTPPIPKISTPQFSCLSFIPDFAQQSLPDYQS